MTDPCGGNVPGDFWVRAVGVNSAAVGIGAEAVALGMGVITDAGIVYVDLTDAEQVAWWRAQVAPMPPLPTRPLTRWERLRRAVWRP